MNRFSALALSAAMSCTTPPSELDTNKGLKEELVGIGTTFIETATANDDEQLAVKLQPIENQLFDWMNKLAEVDAEGECFKANWNIGAGVERHATLSIGFDNQIGKEWFHIGYLLSKDPQGERLVRRTVPLFYLAGDLVCDPYEASVHFRVDEGGEDGPYTSSSTQPLNRVATPTQ